MKSRLLVVLIVINLIAVAPVSAAFLGQMRSAETSGWGSLNLLTGAGIFEDAFSLMGTVRYGIASQVDASASLVILDHEASDDITFVIGGDLQYRISHFELGSPLDIAVGGGVEYYSLDVKGGGSSASNLALGFNLIASRPVTTPAEFNFTPYGRLNLRVDRTSIDYERDLAGSLQNDATDSEFNIGLNLGSTFHLSSKVSLVGELQLDDQVAFIAGINFFMW
jgi:hypothetical protein